MAAASEASTDAVLAGNGHGLFNSSPQVEVPSVLQQVADLSAQVADLKAQLADAREKLQSAEARAHSAEERAKEQLAEAKAQLDEERAKSAALSDALAALQLHPRGLAPPSLPSFLATLGLSVKRPSRRNSLGAVMTPVTVRWHKAGNHFRFVNREEQARALLAAVCNMEVIRLYDDPPQSSWEAHKRNLYVPICTGLSGLGKTRFARDAIQHLADMAARKALGIHAEGAPIDSIIAVAASIAPEPRFASLCRSLVRATYLDCSLRLDCSDLSDFSEEGVAKALVNEWLKGSSAPATALTVPADLRFSLLEAVTQIFAHTPKDDKDEACEPSLLINVDEAHQSPKAELGVFLRKMLQLLVVHKLRVFVVVTGVAADTIRSALQHSSVQAHEIVLPLLKVPHTEQILQGFFPGLDTTKHWIQHVLWWVGGVPRFLQHMIAAAADRCGQKSAQGWGLREPVSRHLQELTGSTASDLVAAVAAVVYTGTSFVSNELERTFAFALLEIPVPRSLQLAPTVTVETAQCNSHLYWDPVDAEDVAPERRGLIVLPPLVMHWLQKKLQAKTARVHLLDYFIPFSTPRDEESLAVTVLMHKFEALSLLDRTKASLSELGVPTHASLLPDREVTVPTAFSVGVVPHTVTADNFADFAAFVRSQDRSPVAFVNKPTAPFADAFIVLQDFIIFIQEKQRATARGAAAAGMSIRQLGSEELISEHDKLGSVAAEFPHAFLLITDEATPNVGRRRKNACVLCPEDHPKLLGKAVAHLRSMAIGASAIDASHRAAVLEI